MQGIKVGNSRFIKDLNQGGIFKLIHKFGPVSRKQLAEKTKYSAATISNHVKVLIEKGYVIETEKGYSTGGRKPVYLTVNPEKGYIFSVEIEVNRVKLVMFNLKLVIVMKSIFPLDNREDITGTIDKIFTEIDSMVREKEINFEDILGIGVGVPGLINKETGLLEFAPNLGWSNVRIIDYLKEKYNLPVFLENEANASAIGEKEFVYPEADNMVFVSVNEGVGCGIIINGQLYGGASGNAGEYGHIIIDDDGPECHCGNRGCWETLASENFIIRRYQQLTGQYKEQDEIYDLGDSKDDKAMLVFREEGNNLGLGLANIINSLSPKLVVIGGGIIKIKEYIKENVLRVVARKSLDNSHQKVEIKFSKLNDSAVVHGLASYVFDECINFIRE